MATRATRDLSNARIVKMRVQAAAATVAIGRTVKAGTLDNDCLLVAAGELGYGVCIAHLDSLVGAAGGFITVAVLAGACVIPVKVGTGGATFGALLQTVADGVTNVTPVAAGTTLVWAHGFAVETGVAGDLIGMIPSQTWVNEA
jgi:hypothetical protein